MTEDRRDLHTLHLVIKNNVFTTYTLKFFHIIHFSLSNSKKNKQIREFIKSLKYTRSENLGSYNTQSHPHTILTRILSTLLIFTFWKRRFRQRRSTTICNRRLQVCVCRSTLGHLMPLGLHQRGWWTNFANILRTHFATHFIHG